MLNNVDYNTLVQNSVRNMTAEMKEGHVYNPCIVMVGQLNNKGGREYSDVLATIHMNL